MTDTVLITGCSTGIGETTARLFLANDWEVYATAREPAAIDHLEALGANTERLDVTGDGDAERAIERVVSEAGHVDCLVNNAGYGQLGPVEDVPVEAVREQFEVNAFGPHKLMRAAVPYLRRRKGGTVINVGSFNVRFPFAGTGVYTASKAALTATTQALRQEVAAHGVDVVVVEPGFVATDFYERALAELDDLPQSPTYDRLYRMLERMRAIEGGGVGITGPDQVARTIVRAAHSDSPKNRYEVGSLARAGRLLGAVVPESWRTALMSGGIRAMTSRPGRKLLAWWARRRPPRAEPAAGRGEPRQADSGAGPARTAPDGDT